ncbi:MAG: FtsX-like permease family protein, partial [Pirellulales bacterium]|nr:FtsX-like permease family protein [Pirellulales bacterium]
KPLNGQVLSLPDRREPVINDIMIKRGSYFTGRRENEVIVNEAFALKHKLHPGQWIHLVLNNRRQELFIVGTAISSEFVYLLGPGAIVPDPEHFGIFYLKQTYAEDVFDFDGAANQVLGLLSPAARETPELVLDRAERLLAPYGVFTTTPLADQPSNKFLSLEIKGLRNFTVIMPAIFLGVAAVVLNVLLSRLAEQQRTVVGTLKALGYTDRQVFAHFLKFGLVVGLLGALVGALGGSLTAWGMTHMYRKFYEFPELTSRFYPSVLVGGLAISLVCAVLGSLRGARAVLRLHPAEAMRPKPPRAGHRTVLERIGWFWNRLTPNWRMALRSTMRNRARTATAVFAGAMGACLLSSTFMMVLALSHLIDFQFRSIIRSDIDLTLADERGEDALAEAAGLPGVDRAEPQLNVAGTFVNGRHEKKGAITGLAPGATLTVPRNLEGRPIRIPTDGLAMTRQLADTLGVGRGDWISFRPTQGLRRPFRAPVLEIADSYLGMAVYTDIHYLSRLVDEELAVNRIQLLTDKNPGHLAALYHELKQLPVLKGVDSRADMMRNLEATLIDNTYASLLPMIIFAGILFFGAILNSSLIALAERQREMATLRVLGYGPWRLGSLLLRESLVTTLAGTLLGMPLGYGLTAAIAAMYASDLFRFPVVASGTVWIATAALAVLYGLSAHGFVQRAVHRMDWLDALQAKE